MPRLFTMDDHNTPIGPNMQHALPNSNAPMQRMQPPAPFHPFMALNGNTGPPTSNPTLTSHKMFANQQQQQQQPHGQAQAQALRGLPFEYNRAAQPQSQVQSQSQATRNGPPGPGPGPARLPSDNYHHNGGTSSTTMGPSPNSVREREHEQQGQTMRPSSSVREREQQGQAHTLAPTPMEHQYHSEQQRYAGASVPNNHQSWSHHYPGNQQQSQHQYHQQQQQQRMMYQDPHGRGSPYHAPNLTNHHPYSHPNNSNNRRSSFPAPLLPPPPPLHAFHRPNGRICNPKMQPPNRRFTFNALTAPNKLMEQHNQNQAARRSPPSPMGIPAPPSFESGVSSTHQNHQGQDDQGSKQHEHDNDVASNKKAKDSRGEQQEQHTPLRELRHQNMHVPFQNMKVDDASTPGGRKAPVSTGGSSNVDTASILLELRTFNSSSPDIHVNENENNSIIKTANTATNTTAEKEEQENPPTPIRTTNLVPKNYPQRLALEDDDNKLNTLHCFIRSELLEIFVVDQSICSSPTSAAGSGSALGRVGLRCVHCAEERKRLKVSDRNEAPMAVFYPKCISEIYRLITSWQRCHLRKCRNLPPRVREQWDELRKEDRSRGKTAYWVTSATQLGLVDCQSKGRGVRFSPEMIAEHNGEHS